MGADPLNAAPPDANICANVRHCSFPLNLGAGHAIPRFLRRLDRGAQRPIEATGGRPFGRPFPFVLAAYRWSRSPFPYHMTRTPVILGASHIACREGC